MEEVSTTLAKTTSTTFFEDDKDDDNLKAAISGFKDYHVNLLKRQSKQNALAITNYLLAMNEEVNPSTSHKISQIITLCQLSESCNQKPFFENDKRTRYGIS